MATKKKPAEVEAKPEAPNKSEFIRSLPDKSPSEVVAAAKANGIDIAPGLVYQVRNNAKAKAVGKAPKGGGSAEVEFIRAAAKVGLANARSLLAALEAL